jgi:Xaa-Pro aminopeptidase
MGHAARLEGLRARLVELDAAAMLVTNGVDVRWLVGFTGSAGDLLVTAEDAVLLTDGRYRSQAAAQLASAGVRVEVEADHARHVERLARAVPQGAAVVLQAEHVSWARQRQLAEGALTGRTLLASTGVLAGMRAVKDAGEVARIEAAAAIADAALEEVRPRLVPGTTEQAFALALDTTMRELGASGPSFETIVASGPNGALPHHRPGNRAFEEGDLVVVDFGATVDGYRSDMTRTFAIGALSATQQRMLDVVTEAQAAGVATVRAGVPAAEVDAACRSVIAVAGWGDAFLHGTGHGVGLDIHEEPRVGATSTAVLRAGEVVTVEPGVYLPEHGGVRVEDTLLVTPSAARPLTQFPKLRS